MKSHVFKLVVETIKMFILGGNAQFTCVSHKTGMKLTFSVLKAKKAENAGLYYVSGWNGARFIYLGTIFKHSLEFRPTDTVPAEVLGSISFQAFDYIWKKIVANDSVKADFLYGGRCSKCGRKLKDEKILSRGLGHNCAKKITL